MQRGAQDRTSKIFDDNGVDLHLTLALIRVDLPIRLTRL